MLVGAQLFERGRWKSRLLLGFAPKKLELACKVFYIEGGSKEVCK